MLDNETEKLSLFDNTKQTKLETLLAQMNGSYKANVRESTIRLYPISRNYD